MNEPYKGTLSSYAWVLLAIHFLQTTNPPVLPCLQVRGPLGRGEREGVSHGLGVSRRQVRSRVQEDQEGGEGC